MIYFFATHSQLYRVLYNCCRYCTVKTFVLVVIFSKAMYVNWPNNFGLYRSLDGSYRRLVCYVINGDRMRINNVETFVKIVTPSVSIGHGPMSPP